MDWNPQVHRETAELDGLTPADFTWLRYPCSEPRITLSTSRHQPILFHCRVPPETPQVNVYVLTADKRPGVEYEKVEGDWWKVPDPLGSALSRVEFELRDAATGDVLASSGSPNHAGGGVEGGANSSAMLWHVLTPGGSLRVRLRARGLFFPFNDPLKGDGGNQYSTVNRGYLDTPWVETGVHVLAMDDEGNLLLERQRAGGLMAGRLYRLEISESSEAADATAVLVCADCGNELLESDEDQADGFTAAHLETYRCACAQEGE